jgi:methylated-DNA-[protein]-cysteine S-methyltransferase
MKEASICLLSWAVVRLVKDMTYYTILKNRAVGDLLFTANDTDLTGLYRLDSGEAPKIKRGWARKPGQRVLAAAVKQIKEYLAGQRKDFTVPIHFDGTEFQEKIWTYTMRIPYGATMSYAELAKKAGAPAAVRATGSALGRTPIDFIIPAHRVISKSGRAGGFSGNWEKKMHLLGLEQEVMARGAISVTGQERRDAASRR